MCNYCHEFTREEIKKEGIAWKLFPKDGRIRPLFGNIFHYFYGENRWVKWVNNVVYNPHHEDEKYFGFCAFKTRKEARGANSNYRVRKIQYKDGVGSCISNEYDGESRKFIFFKQFKVLEEKV
jgi:hypothetical protein